MSDTEAFLDTLEALAERVDPGLTLRALLSQASALPPPADRQLAHEVAHGVGQLAAGAVRAVITVGGPGRASQSVALGPFTPAHETTLAGPAAELVFIAAHALAGAVGARHGLHVATLSDDERHALTLAALGAATAIAERALDDGTGIVLTSPSASDDEAYERAVSQLGSTDFRSACTRAVALGVEAVAFLPQVRGMSHFHLRRLDDGALAAAVPQRIALGSAEFTAVVQSLHTKHLEETANALA